ncbi:hypothetical protein WA1_07910 [Scytonema hofmannii PCC 7110]|uniref:Uncharacterized protein n=1 Tax=Scytonema hofmannii PCC 7110 TaxID=128403 RepID=A0A139WTG6_9CYAN|nr:cobaltochelatase subunit CobN [Scytonema hofmannii]KYC35721.1 hypothetical protein WA1_07910 [Scytonema hofmannii PCC 7110]
MPGDDAPDSHLISLFTLPLNTVHQVWRSGVSRVLRFFTVRQSIGERWGLGTRIPTLVVPENLHLDLRFAHSSFLMGNAKELLAISKINGYLCELKEAQIQDRWRIFGQCLLLQHLMNQKNKIH